MKFSPTERIIQEKMKPGILSYDGFLGTDKRFYLDIIAEDKRTVSSFDKTQQEIAEKMNYIMEKSFQSYDGEIVVDGKYEVEYSSFRGILISPFPNSGKFGKAIVRVTNINSNKTILWTPLHVHFIKDYCFFEGKGSKFRIDPEMLYQVLFG